MANIVVFDSGIGGLTVLKELVNLLPNEHYTYIADQKNLPYGNKTEEQLKEIVWNVVQQHVPNDIDVLVLACNTATAVMHKELTKRMNYPIVGTVKAGGQEAVERVVGGEVGIIATKQTIDNNLYHRHIDKNSKIYQKNVKARGIPCPELASAIEFIPKNEIEKKQKKEVIKKLLHSYLSPHILEINGLVYGCTHYPLIENFIQELIVENDWEQAKNIPFINPAKLMAKEVEDIIKGKQNSNETGSLHLIVTKDEELFIKKTKEWFDDSFVRMLQNNIFKK